MGQGHVLVDAVDERCILVGVISGSTTEAQAEEYLDELQFLALTAGAISEKRFVQKLQFPNPKTYVGSGKLEEIRKYVESNAIDLSLSMMN